VGLLVYQSLRPRPIYYVTTTRGVAEPGHVPEAVVEGFAARVVGLLGNLTPATAAVGYDQSRRYLAPRVVKEAEGIAILNVRKPGQIDRKHRGELPP
jgi:hypothetical protein